MLFCYLSVPLQILCTVQGLYMQTELPGKREFQGALIRGQRYLHDKSWGIPGRGKPLWVATEATRFLRGHSGSVREQFHREGNAGDIEGSGCWICKPTVGGLTSKQTHNQKKFKCRWGELTRVGREGGIRSRGNSSEWPSRTRSCHSCLDRKDHTQRSKREACASNPKTWILN